MTSRLPRLDCPQAYSDRSVVCFRVGRTPYQIIDCDTAARLLRQTKDGEIGTHGPYWIDVVDAQILAAGLRFRERVLKSDRTHTPQLQRDQPQQEEEQAA
jgi:hypothetical protein